MNDKYKHDPDGMATCITNFERMIEDYNNKLQEIQNLINHMDSSPLWKNAAIKEAYNNTCNGYMKIHSNRSLKASFNIEKLKEKTRKIAEFEQAYSKEW